MPGLRIRNRYKQYEIYKNVIPRMIGNLRYPDEFMVEEGLNYLGQVFPDAEISFFDREKQVLLSTTIQNAEWAGELAAILKRTKCEEVEAYTNRRGHTKAASAVRKAVAEMTIFPISLGTVGRYYIAIERYDTELIPRGEDIECCLELLAVTKLVQDYKKSMNEYLLLNRNSMLKARECLYDDLKELSGGDNAQGTPYSLSIIDIRNMNELRRTIGIEAAETLISKSATVLNKHREYKVYQYSEHSFAVVIHKDLYYAHIDIAQVMDQLAELEALMVLSAVIAPIVSDIYETIYCAESNLSRAAEDSIIVVREKANEDRFFVKYDSEKILLESHSRVRDATNEVDNFYDIGKYEAVSEQSLDAQHEQLMPEAVSSEREDGGGTEEEPNKTRVKDDQKETNASQVEYFYDLFSQFKEDE